ncbi:SRPBCC family protein [Amycolatopsis taiwanensis]|uniref:Coenzyme Q-binding protein COQ10 START domain-containing protein n=1 Tax=Amycolatopsis taiwanensis TaxID=342230 RepID=A0A9W6QYX8_9PSEU|nr:SRPBCC family protein [Amycolatopsis taiwanensis]GLY65128.1 hypothetical protein Atai01_17470 [Amycolatopsis taiwanensis]
MVAKQVKDAVGQAPQRVEEAVGDLPGQAGQAVSKVVPSDQLSEALRKLVETLVARGANALVGKVTSASGRLTEFAEGGGDGGLLSALTGGGGGIKGKAMLGAVKGGLSGVTDKVKDQVSGLAGGLLGGKGGRSKTNQLKVTNIVEEIDVGVPVDLAYDLWTRFTDFPTFMKKVENVEQVSDENLRWKAQIWWSHRAWESDIVEQVPEEHIIWRSKGDKGYVDGAVSFHELSPDLTRIMLVLEYHPKGFVERTGNIWRAQGRRVRLELKHFRRHAMTYALLHPDEIEGWHGEIRDGEVVDGRSEEDTGRAGAETEEEAGEEAAEEAAGRGESPEGGVPEPRGEPVGAGTAGRERGSNG